MPDDAELPSSETIQHFSLRCKSAVEAQAGAFERHECDQLKRIDQDR